MQFLNFLKPLAWTAVPCMYEGHTHAKNKKKLKPFQRDWMFAFLWGEHALLAQEQNVFKYHVFPMLTHEDFVQKKLLRLHF